MRLENYLEGCSLYIAACDRDGAAVCVSNALSDCEPEAESALALTTSRLVGAVEPLEHVGEILRVDWVAHVVDGERGLSAHLHKPYGDHRVLLRVLAGVVYEDTYKPFDPFGIALYVQPFLDIRLKHAAALEGNGVELERGRLHRLAEVDVLVAHGVG